MKIAAILSILLAIILVAGCASSPTDYALNRQGPVARFFDSLTNYPDDFDHGPNCVEIADMSIEHIKATYQAEPKVAVGWDISGAGHAQVLFSGQWYGLKYGEITTVKNPFYKDEYRILTVAQFNKMKDWPASIVINGGHRKFKTPMPEATRIRRGMPWTLEM